MSQQTAIEVLEKRIKRLDRFSYKLDESGQFGLDVPFADNLDIDESSMSVVIPFADGNRRDGVGDLLEIGGIRTDRHRMNPVVLFDHGKAITLPIALAEDPRNKSYTVELDTVSKQARCKAFFYQGKGMNGLDRDGDHGLFCEQLFDLIAKRYIRAGSIGYQALKAMKLPADYATGTPEGLHLLVTSLLEASAVVVPANQDTVLKALSLPKICGKPPCAHLVKSLSLYAPARKVQLAWDQPKSHAVRTKYRSKGTIRLTREGNPAKPLNSIYSFSDDASPYIRTTVTANDGTVLSSPVGIRSRDKQEAVQGAERMSNELVGEPYTIQDDAPDYSDPGAEHPELDEDGKALIRIIRPNTDAGETKYRTVIHDNPTTDSYPNLTRETHHSTAQAARGHAALAQDMHRFYGEHSEIRDHTTEPKSEREALYQDAMSGKIPLGVVDDYDQDHPHEAKAINPLLAGTKNVRLKYRNSKAVMRTRRLNSHHMQLPTDGELYRVELQNTQGNWNSYYTTASQTDAQQTAERSTAQGNQYRNPADPIRNDYRPQSSYALENGKGIVRVRRDETGVEPTNVITARNTQGNIARFSITHPDIERAEHIAEINAEHQTQLTGEDFEVDSRPWASYAAENGKAIIRVRTDRSGNAHPLTPYIVTSMGTQEEGGYLPAHHMFVDEANNDARAMQADLVYEPEQEQNHPWRVDSRPQSSFVGENGKAYRHYENELSNSNVPPPKWKPGVGACKSHEVRLRYRAKAVHIREIPEDDPRHRYLSGERYEVEDRGKTGRVEDAQPSPFGEGLQGYPHHYHGVVENLPLANTVARTVERQVGGGIIDETKKKAVEINQERGLYKVTQHAKDGRPVGIPTLVDTPTPRADAQGEAQRVQQSTGGGPIIDRTTKGVRLKYRGKGTVRITREGNPAYPRNMIYEDVLTGGEDAPHYTTTVYRDNGSLVRRNAHRSPNKPDASNYAERTAEAWQGNAGETYTVQDDAPDYSDPGAEHLELDEDGKAIIRITRSKDPVTGKPSFRLQRHSNPTTNAAWDSADRHFSDPEEARNQAANLSPIWEYYHNEPSPVEDYTTEPKSEREAIEQDVMSGNTPPGVLDDYDQDHPQTQKAIRGIERPYHSVSPLRLRNRVPLTTFAHSVDPSPLDVHRGAVKSLRLKYRQKNTTPGPEIRLSRTGTPGRDKKQPYGETYHVDTYEGGERTRTTSYLHEDIARELANTLDDINKRSDRVHGTQSTFRDQTGGVPKK